MRLFCAIFNHSERAHLEKRNIVKLDFFRVFRVFRFPRTGFFEVSKPKIAHANLVQVQDKI